MIEAILAAFLVHPRVPLFLLPSALGPMGFME
jgi:hypothetical protein